MQRQYRIFQVIILILSIIAVDYCLLWTFHYLQISPYPNNEIYILAASYSVILIVSAIVTKSTKPQTIHSVMGFSQTSSKVIMIALLIGILLWVSDYLYQIYLLQNSLFLEAKEWTTNHPDQLITLISMVIFAPVIEEIVLRGILLHSLTRYMNKFLATIMVSIIFTLLHDSYEQWPTLFIASALYCWLTLHSKSIVPAIVAHILNNAFTFILYKLLII